MGADSTCQTDHKWWARPPCTALKTYVTLQVGFCLAGPWLAVLVLGSPVWPGSTAATSVKTWWGLSPSPSVLGRSAGFNSRACRAWPGCPGLVTPSAAAQGWKEMLEAVTAPPMQRSRHSTAARDGTPSLSPLPEELQGSTFCCSLLAWLRGGCLWGLQVVQRCLGTAWSQAEPQGQACSTAPSCLQSLAAKRKDQAVAQLVHGSPGQHRACAASFQRGELAMFETRKYPVLPFSTTTQAKLKAEQCWFPFFSRTSLPMQVTWGRGSGARRVVAEWDVKCVKRGRIPFPWDPPVLPQAQPVLRATKQRQLLLKALWGPSGSSGCFTNTSWHRGVGQRLPASLCRQQRAGWTAELPGRDMTMFLFLCFNCYDSQVTRGWGSERDVSRSANPGLLHPASPALPSSHHPWDRPFSHSSSKKNDWGRVPLTQEQFLFLLSSPWPLSVSQDVLGTSGIWLWEIILWGALGSCSMFLFQIPSDIFLQYFYWKKQKQTTTTKTKTKQKANKHQMNQPQTQPQEKKLD